MGFSNPILGGTVLVRPAIKSPNYVPGVAGWSINRDGSAEFQNLISRGTIIAGAPNGKRIVIDNATGEIDIYDAANNLIAKLDGTTGLQVFDIQIKEGATQLQQGQWETQTINVAKRGITVEYVTPNPPAPGNHTYSATMLRQVGTGIITAQGAAGRPIQLITEQVGG